MRNGHFKEILISLLVVISCVFGMNTYADAAVISDVKVCNLKGRGATITWLTDVAAIGEDSVRVVNPSIALNAVFTASRIGFNTHLVDISGLTPSTTGYSFEVISEGAESSGTFDTPAEFGNAPQTATVKVINQDSTDAEGVLVSTIVTDLSLAGPPFNIKLPSLPICGITGPTGIAVLSLDLAVKEAGLGNMAFNAASTGGFDLILEAKDGKGNSASSGPFVTPININVDIDTLRLSAAIEVVIPLPEGLTLISPPVEPKNTFTSHTLLPLIPNSREIDRWDNAAGRFRPVVRDVITGNIITPIDQAFDVAAPEGFFVKVISSSAVTFSGLPITIPLSLTLPEGLTLIGVPLPLGFTSHTLLPLIANSREIDRWDNAAGRFRPVVRDVITGNIITPIDQAFNINLGEGYFVKVVASTVFTPPTSAPKAIAPELYEDFRRFEEISTNVLPSEVKVSNVTDLGVTVSWLGAENHLAQVQYSTDPDLSYYESAYDAMEAEYPDDIHWVDIPRLSPSTRYYFRILPLDPNDKREDKVRSFTTTPRLNSIPYPNTIYGKVIEEGGKDIGVRGVVYAKVIHKGRESYPVSATTSASGYWSLSLGHLRDRESGDLFRYSSGDAIVLEYYGLSGRYGIQKAEVETDTPQDVGELIVTDTITLRVPGFDGVDGSDIPQAYVLHQNFPNPFNPETEISYDIPEDAHVSLRIYNALGQLVRTLVDGNQKTSHYVVRWDGRDDKGTDLASGVYFYRVLTDNFASTKRMLLMR